MIKLGDILKEVGENTAQPYPLTKQSKSEFVREYQFQTDSGTPYVIYIEKDTSESEELGRFIEYDVSFGVKKKVYISTQGSVDYDVEINDPKNVFRVMATVINAIKQSIAIDEESRIPVRKITISPSKRTIKEPSGLTVTDQSDKRRENMYRAYIEKNAPAGSEVITYPSSNTMVIILPKKKL